MAAENFWMPGWNSDGRACLAWAYIENGGGIVTTGRNSRRALKADTASR